MYGLSKQQIGTLATDTERAVWPEKDVFGGDYLRESVTMHMLADNEGDKATRFAVVPPARTWERPARSTRHIDAAAADEAAAKAAADAKPVFKAEGNK